MSNKSKRINWNQARNMDVDAWRDRQIHKRLAACLAQQEQDFILAHGGDTDAELIAYIRRMAGELRRMPHPLELPGGEYLKKRLGNWDQLAQSLGYGPANGQKGKLARQRLKQKVEEDFQQERRALRTQKKQGKSAKNRQPEKAVVQSE